jgi:hypothetical protein
MISNGYSCSAESYQLQTKPKPLNFTNVPGGISLLGSVGTLRFAPVTSRFVRVNILNLFGSGNGLEEMAVSPE